MGECRQGWSGAGLADFGVGGGGGSGCWQAAGGLRVNQPLRMEGNKLGVLGGEGGRLFLHLDGFEPFLTGRETAVLGLGDEAGLDVWPFLLPAVITEEVAQGEHGVDVTTLPVHAGAL